MNSGRAPVAAGEVSLEYHHQHVTGVILRKLLFLRRVKIHSVDDTYILRWIPVWRFDS